MYSEMLARVSAVVLFIGFNLTFFPQYILGWAGMPRRYHAYAQEFQLLNVFSSAGSVMLAVGYLLPLFYLLWSLRYGPRATANPWDARGLEWTVSSPPEKGNFRSVPRVDREAYDYDHPA
jgi:cytochrome c oxidase subunit 1